MADETTLEIVLSSESTVGNPIVETVTVVGTVPVGPRGMTGPAGPTGATGETGATGATGPAGPAGPAGADGADGADGVPGAAGADGDDGREVELQKSATHIQWRYVGEVAWTNLVALVDITGPAGADGADGAAGADGADGAAGTDGADGVDGKTVLNGTTAPGAGLGVDGDFYIRTSDWTIYGPKTAGAWGSPTSLVGPQGPAGADGADGAPGADGADGQGVPVGGTTGQLLAKNSNTDFDTEWIDAPSGGGVSDGDKGDITVSSSGTVWNIDNDVITNAKLANMAQATIKGRQAGGGTGDPEDLTAAQARTAMGLGTAATADTGTGSSNVLTKSGADGLYASVGGKTVTSKTTTYTAANGDIVLASASGGTWVLTLPPAAAGAWVTVKKTDSTTNAITVTPGSGTIDGASTYPITVQYRSRDFVSDGTNWFVA